MKMIRTLCLISVLAMAVPVAPAAADQALGLDGIDALAREGAVPSPSPLDVATFTVEAWVFPSAPARTMNVASDSGYVLQICVGSDCHVQNPPPNVSGIELFLFKPGVNEPVVAGVVGGPGAPDEILFGQWNHIAASFNSTTQQCTLSVNGNSTVLNECLEGPLDINFDQRFGIGVSDAGDESGMDIVTLNTFAGQISSFRTSNTVRYPPQPSVPDYTPACPVADRATLGLWYFHDAVGSTTFTDSSGAGHTLSGLNGAATVVKALPCLPQPTAGFLGDFNGDGKTDILWRQQPGGQLEMWLMDGAIVLEKVSLGALDTVWHLIALADFNGDGKTDILWRRQSDGALSMWLMDGSTVASQASLGVLDPSWQLATVGDFNGDDNRDLLWSHSSGALSMWLMNGTVVVNQASLGVLDTSWLLVTKGDFNGDGTTDLLWRNVNGGMSMWLMNGTVVTNQASLGVLDTSWQLLAGADFNGDNKTDLLWRDVTGSMSMWLMDGPTVSSTPSLGFLDPQIWQLAGVGHFNAGLNADLLWRNHASGSGSVWLMNAGVATPTPIESLDPSWVVEDGS